MDLIRSPCNECDDDCGCHVSAIPGLGCSGQKCKWCVMLLRMESTILMHDEKLLLYFVERPPTTLKYLLKIHYKLNIKLECGVSTLNLYAFPQNFHQSMNISHVTYRLHVCERPSSRQQPHSYSECMSGVWPRLVHSTAANDPSAGTRQQPIFIITIRAFSWLKAPISIFMFKTLWRHYQYTDSWYPPILGMNGS